MAPNFDFEYVTFEELMRAYLCCRKKKRHTPNAASFEINLTENLYKLYLELNRMEYKVGKSITFIVSEPVYREVFAADFRDRIVHHLVINRMMETFEKKFIPNSFSCRVGKGTLKAAMTLAEEARLLSDDYKEEVWILKCDLKSFFMTIDKEALYQKIASLVDEIYGGGGGKQCEFLKWLCSLIINNKPQYSCERRSKPYLWSKLPKEKSLFYVNPRFGIPIGNLTSQIFANYFLSDFDIYVSKELGFRYYGRYVDDFYILSKDKSELASLVPKLREKLKEIGITLHPKKIYLQNLSKGVNFVGIVIKPNRTYISNRTYSNLKEMLHSANRLIRSKIPTIGEINHFVSSFNSYLGYLKHHKTYNIRRKVFVSNEFKPWLKHCYIDSSMFKIAIYKKKGDKTLPPFLNSSSNQLFSGGAHVEFHHNLISLH